MISVFTAHPKAIRAPSDLITKYHPAGSHGSTAVCHCKCIPGYCRGQALVSLETVGAITPDDARVHFVDGQILGSSNASAYSLKVPGPCQLRISIHAQQEDLQHTWTSGRNSIRMLRHEENDSMPGKRALVSICVHWSFRKKRPLKVSHGVTIYDPCKT